MSWISDLADRAENILNKIDQNAATVLSSSTQVVTVDDENLITNTKENEQPTLLLQKKPILSTPRKKSPKKASDLSTNFDKKENAEIKDKEPLTNLEHISDKELVAFKIALADIKAERDELKIEVGKLKDELKTAKGEEKILELEKQIENLKIQRDEVNEKLSKLSTANDDYAKTLSELEGALAQKRQDLYDVNEKLSNQIKETEQKSVDLEQYRKKAQSTLQMKDKIIEELRQGNINRIENLDADQNNFHQLEIERLKHDNVINSNQIIELQQEIDEANNLVEQLHKELKEKELEIDNIRNMTMNNIKIEQEKSLNLEAELKLLNHEISAIRQESNRQRKLHMAQLHEKEQQLNKLKKGNADYQAVGDSNNVEARLQSLTQALFQKQTSLETITSEKNALKLQLEKVEDQLRHVINQGRNVNTQVIHVNDTDDAKSQFPIIMRENPFDTRVARRVKRAYSSLDSAGIRVGVFLRRYPLIRIAVLIYIAFVHLWVIFVLLSSTPT